MDKQALLNASVATAAITLVSTGAFLVSQEKIWEGLAVFVVGAVVGYLYEKL